MNPKLESRIWTDIAVRSFQFLVDEYGFASGRRWLDPTRRGNGSVEWLLPGKFCLSVEGDCDDRVYFEIRPVVSEPTMEAPSRKYGPMIPVGFIAGSFAKVQDAAFRWRRNSLPCPWSKRNAEEQFKRWSQLLRIDCEPLLKGEPYDWNKLCSELDEAVKRADDSRSWEKIKGFPKLR